MNEAMTRLFESVDSGFMWIDKDARIRYLNAKAAAMTGLQLGHDVPEGALQRTVRAALQGMQPLPLPAPSGNGRTLTYQVMRGLMRDDAVVFVTSDAPGSVDVGLDNLLANDRIDMWEMLLDVWKPIEAIAQTKKQNVRFSRYPADEPLATVYGSSVWLRRVFRECLEAELRKASAGATIDIEYRQMGTRVLVAFRDNGLFPPRRDGAEALNPAQNTAATARNARAPARYDHAEIDMQQAQRYAPDIAERMARRRKRA